MSKPKDKNLIETSISPPKFDPEKFKAEYYYLNARPDSEMRLFSDEKLVSLENILELNQRILAKVKNHNFINFIAEISVSLSDNNILSFGDWSAFESHNWKVSPYIKEIRISWDINLMLPGYQFPQRHKVNLRLGSTLKPGEIMDLIHKGGPDYEIEQLFANAVCKVDFINPVISTEILNIVADWHGSLRDVNAHKPKWQKLIQKKPVEVGRLVEMLIKVATLLLVFNILRVYELYFDKSLEPVFKVNDFYIWLVMGGVIMLISSYIADIIGNYTHRLVHKMGGHSHNFLITSGDINRCEELKMRDHKLLKNVLTSVFVSLVTAIILLIITILRSFIQF